METILDRPAEPAEASPGLPARIGNLLRSGYESARRNIEMGLALGATIFSVANAAELALNPEPLAAEPLPTKPSPATLPGAPERLSETAHASAATHTHSTLQPQTVLDSIHHVALPNDPWRPKDKAWVRPTHAFLKPSAVGFKTDCGRHPGPGAWGNAYSYVYYKQNVYGIYFKTCGPMWPPDQKGVQPNQFVPKLTSLGNRIQRSVRLDFPETVKTVSGSRKKVVAQYVCPSPETGTAAPQTPAGVKKITIYAKHKKAAVIPC